MSEHVKSDLDLEKGELVSVLVEQSSEDWYKVKCRHDYWSDGKVHATFKDLVTVALQDQSGWPTGEYLTVPTTPAFVRSLNVSP